MVGFRWDGRDSNFCSISIFAQNFSRVQPPGLLRARGDNPNGGKIKKRILPEDVVINCSEGSKVPEPPRGHRYGTLRTPTLGEVLLLQVEKRPPRSKCWVASSLATAPLHGNLLLHDLVSCREAPATEQQGEVRDGPEAQAQGGRDQRSRLEQHEVRVHEGEAACGGRLLDRQVGAQGWHGEESWRWSRHGESYSCFLCFQSFLCENPLTRWAAAPFS